jgi:NADH:ubiquinone oxidoreductase subunit 6 (subunit J)
MNAVTFLYYFFIAMAAGSALGIIFIRNVFYGALLLICCLLSVAAIYAFTFAEFVAVTQILIYAGGILVVIIFGIMLTSKNSGRPLVVEHKYIGSGALIGLLFCGTLMYYFSLERFPMPAGHAQHQNIPTIGINLMQAYVLPFEIAGVLLLVSLIGAMVIASSAKSKDI